MIGYTGEEAFLKDSENICNLSFVLWSHSATVEFTLVHSKQISEADLFPAWGREGVRLEMS